MEEGADGPRHSESALIGDIAYVSRKIWDFRRAREDALDDEIFSDFAWDIILSIAIHSNDGRGVTKSTILDFLNGPESTVLRWLDILLDRGLVIIDSRTKHCRYSLSKNCASSILNLSRDLCRQCN